MHLTIVLALVSWLPGEREGSSVGKVCGGLMPTEVTGCFAAVGGRYVDPDAAELCGRQMTARPRPTWPSSTPRSSASKAKTAASPPRSSPRPSKQSAGSLTENCPNQVPAV